MKSAERAKQRLIAVIHDDRVATQPNSAKQVMPGLGQFSMVMRPVTYKKPERRRE